MNTFYVITGLAVVSGAAWFHDAFSGTVVTMVCFVIGTAWIMCGEKSKC